MISLRLAEDRFAAAVLDIDGDAVERVAEEAREKGHAAAACGIDVFDRTEWTRRSTRPFYVTRFRLR